MQNQNKILEVKLIIAMFKNPVNLQPPMLGGNLYPFKQKLEIKP